MANGKSIFWWCMSTMSMLNHGARGCLFQVKPMTIAASLNEKNPKTRGFDTFFDVWWCAAITHMTHHLLNQIYCFTPVIITGLALEAKDWKPWIQYYPPTTAFCLHFSPSTKSKNRTYQMHLLKYCVSSFRYIYYIYIYIGFVYLLTFYLLIYIYILCIFLQVHI